MGVGRRKSMRLHHQSRVPGASPHAASDPLLGHSHADTSIFNIKGIGFNPMTADYRYPDHNAILWSNSCEM